MNAITPPEMKDNARVHKMNLYPMIEPITEKSFMSPAPSIRKTYKTESKIRGKAKPVNDEIKPGTPNKIRFEIKPTINEGNRIKFLIL